MTLQIVRDGVLKLNAHGTSGPIAGKAAGAKPLLTPAHRAALAAMIESGPTPRLHGVVRWPIVDLCRWLWEAFQIGMSPQTLSRELRAMGYRRLSAPPRHHAQAAGAIAAFKGTFPRAWRRSPTSRASTLPR